MEERNAFSFGADAWSFVDQLNAGLSAAFQSCIEVIDREADVMNPRTALRDKARDRGFVAFGFHELDQRLPRAQADDSRAIGVIERYLPEAENLAKEGQGF